MKLWPVYGIYTVTSVIIVTFVTFITFVTFVTFATFVTFELFYHNCHICHQLWKPLFHAITLVSTTGSILGNARRLLFSKQFFDILKILFYGTLQQWVHGTILR